MAVVRKYEFDLSFDQLTPAQIARRKAIEEAAALRNKPPEPPVVAPPPPPPPPPPPAEPSFSVAELRNAEAMAYDRGRSEGEAVAFSRVEMRLAAATESLSFVLRDLARDQRSALDTVEQQAAGLVLLSLRKMFPLCSKLAGTRETEALIREAFAQALEEPRVLVRCAEGLSDMLTPLVTDVARLAGFDGKLTVIGDPALAEGDCRVEWGIGGIERDVGQFMNSVEAAIRGLFPAIEVPELASAISDASGDMARQAANPETHGEAGPA